MWVPGCTAAPGLTAPDHDANGRALGAAVSLWPMPHVIRTPLKVVCKVTSRTDVAVRPVWVVLSEPAGRTGNEYSRTRLSGALPQPSNVVLRGLHRDPDHPPDSPVHLGLP